MVPTSGGVLRFLFSTPLTPYPLPGHILCPSLHGMTLTFLGPPFHVLLASVQRQGPPLQLTRGVSLWAAAETRPSMVTDFINLSELPHFVDIKY